MAEPTIAPIEGVAPNIAEAWLRQTMATRYQRRVPDLTDEEARTHATATWESEWETDPRPRTLEAAIEAVDSDLEYWGEE